MNIHEKYLSRCLEIGANGLGYTAPNPTVGAVVTYEDRIIGEGFTSPFGGPHAEVRAIRSVQDPALLKKATLYVTLEPCCHHGKTPPCTDLILEMGNRETIPVALFVLDSDPVAITSGVPVWTIYPT